MIKIAILDDYANVALQSADWSVSRQGRNHCLRSPSLRGRSGLVLRPFDVLCTVRERMSLAAHPV